MQVICFQKAPNSNYKTREVGADASLLTLNFYVLLALSSKIFSAFKVVYHAIPCLFDC